MKESGMLIRERLVIEHEERYIIFSDEKLKAIYDAIGYYFGMYETNEKDLSGITDLPEHYVDVSGGVSGITTGTITECTDDVFDTKA